MNKPNILLVVIDTLRWDYFQKFLSENYAFSDRLKDFVNFEAAFTPSPWTLPSHFSLFTGLYPSEHGVHENQISELEDIFLKARRYSGDFLTDVAEQQGYQTIGISANPMISSLTGFDRKFDSFYSIDPINLTGYENILQAGKKDIVQEKYASNGFPDKIRKGRSYIKSIMRGYPKNKGYKIALSLIDRIHLSKPFFCFINFMEMHDPYSVNFHRDDNHASLEDLFALRH